MFAGARDPNGLAKFLGQFERIGAIVEFGIGIGVYAGLGHDGQWEGRRAALCPTIGTPSRQTDETEMKGVVRRAGVEPATIRLKVECSTTELPARTKSDAAGVAAEHSHVASAVNRKRCMAQ